MKFVAIGALIFAILSGFSAKWMGSNGSISSITYAVLDDQYDPLVVQFGDLPIHAMGFTGKDPVDTFAFVISTPERSRDVQKVTFNVTGIRNTIPNIALSVRGCDGNGINCYPGNLLESSNIPKPFDRYQLNSSNLATLNISIFALNGSFFFLYLQVPIDPDHDNPNTINQATNSDRSSYGQLITYDKVNDTALTFSLTYDVPSPAKPSSIP